jgi:probable rRNA maturation factor
VTPSVGVVVDDPRWRSRLPDVARICRRAARSALAGTALRSARSVELCVRLADDDVVAELNGRFRGKRAPTNVLSFPQHQGGALRALEEGSGLFMLGDVVLGYETVAREAARDGKPLADHVAHLVVHGVLHLLGLDHVSDAAAARMEAFEVSALARLGVGDPYA